MSERYAEGGTARPPKLKKKDIAVCCAVALLILCAIAARMLNVGNPALSAAVRSGIYMGLTAAWGASLHRRIIQPQARRYLIAVALLMLLWLAERTVKFEFDLPAAIGRRLWYSYYIPMLLIPLLAVFIAMSLGEPEGYRLPRRAGLLYIPTLALIALVLTNDRHQLVFRFPADSRLWIDGNETHAAGYFAAAVWAAACSAGAVIIMAKRCRGPKNRGQWLPMIPVALSVAYTAVYLSGARWLRVIAGDMTAFQCLSVMATLESCIRCGLIQSNTGYEEFFGATTIGAQITDRRFRVRYSSASALPLSREKLEQALEGPVQIDKNTLLNGQEISSGYVFWQEDISELQGVLDELQTVQDELKDTGDALKTEAEQRSYWLKVAEENRLYDMVERQTEKQTALLRELLSRLRETEDTVEARRLLGRIVVIGTYVKRRSNLIFAGRQRGVLDAAEVRLCLDESAAALGLCGIACAVNAEIDGLLAAEDGNRIYDFFEAAVEAGLSSLSSMLFYAREAPDGISLGVALCCDDMGALLCDFPDACTERDEDGIWHASLSIRREGGEWTL